MSSHAVVTKGSAKSLKSKKVLLLTLRLPSSLLTRFPSAPSTTIHEDARQSSVTSLGPVKAPTPNLKEEVETPLPTETAPEVEVEPSPLPFANDEAPTPTAPVSKRKGPAPGSKRSAPALDANGMPKQRGKPGPRKKARTDVDVNSPFGGQVPASSHKLGPKANQGTINANLRALDRSGKPCRKWEKKTFVLKSFTGAGWTMPSWHTHKTIPQIGYDGDVKSDSSSTDAKMNSGRESERGHHDAGMPRHATNPGDIASSPAPLPMMPA